MRRATHDKAATRDGNRLSAHDNTYNFPYNTPIFSYNTPNFPPHRGGVKFHNTAAKRTLSTLAKAYLSTSALLIIVIGLHYLLYRVR